MPKKPGPGSPKKARWTTAQKAAHRKSAQAKPVPGGPKKPHRGQGGAPTRGAQAGSRSDDKPRTRSDDKPRTRSDDKPRTCSDDKPRQRSEVPRSHTRAPRVDSDPARPARSSGPARPARSSDSGRGNRPERAERPAWTAGRDAEAERIEADTWVSARSTKPVPEVGSAAPTAIDGDNGFAALGLPSLIVERLAREGITTPFPIQNATIPDALAGRDVLGRGQTGSGKTLAFGLPMLARLAAEGVRPAPRRPRALVLVPTRELAMQVSDSLEPLAHVLGLRHKLVAGGLSYTTQISALNRGIDLLIATPGRLIDLMQREAVNLGDVRIAVLDEADHMADMGFMPEVTTIMDAVPAGGQRLLFSATLDKGVDEIVSRYLSDPVTHSTDDVTASVTTMEHHVLLIDPQHKKLLTAEVANRRGRTIVFVRTKLGADRVALQLREQGVLAAALHGGLNQNARNRVLGAFRTGTLPVLVATDVAARGIHVDDVAVVLQADPPQDHKDYLHRSGRTARAGDKGTVVTLALPHQRRPMERLLREAGVDTALVKAVPGDVLVASTGALPPTGIPISDEQLKRVLEGEPKTRRAPGGPRGSRPGTSGGFRPHHSGSNRGSYDRRSTRG